MSDDIRAKLAARFNGEVLQFEKTWRKKDGTTGSMTFDYIEDETVMDRLDDVVGVGRWYVKASPVSDLAVRVVLGVDFGQGFVEYEDFGYATRDDSAEPLKEAVSDGIRRCGRYVGIGRYLYHKHRSTSHSPAPTGASSPSRSEAPRSSSPAAAAHPPVAAGSGGDDEDWAGLLEQAAASGAAESVHEAPGRPKAVDACPEHGDAKKRPAKGGKGFYCAGKRPDGTWCDWRQAA